MINFPPFEPVGERIVLLPCCAMAELIKSALSTHIDTGGAVLGENIKKKKVFVFFAYSIIMISIT